MRVAFKYIIIGFLLILFDIHVFIDILPDPVGYLMIFIGTRKLEFKGSSTHPTSVVASILIFASLPTIFLDAQFFSQQVSIGEWWGIYRNVLSLLDIILVYFLFQLIKDVVKTLNSFELIRKTEKMYKWYMIVMLTVLFIQPFLLNINGQAAIGLMLLVVACALITQISFIFFLRNIQKQFTPSSPGKGDKFNIEA